MASSAETFKKLCAWQTRCKNDDEKHRDEFYHPKEELCVYGNDCREKEKCTSNSRVHYEKEGNNLIIDNIRVKTMAAGFKPGRHHNTHANTHANTHVNTHANNQRNPREKFDIIAAYEKSKSEAERAKYIKELTRRVEANIKRNEVYGLIIDDFHRAYPRSKYFNQQLTTSQLKDNQLKDYQLKDSQLTTSQQADGKHKSWADIVDSIVESPEQNNDASKKE